VNKHVIDCSKDVHLIVHRNSNDAVNSPHYRQHWRSAKRRYL